MAVASIVTIVPEQPHIVVALQDQLTDVVYAGEIRHLTYVIRNDGSLTSSSVEMIATLPVDWRISGVSATQGLISISSGEVKITIGSIDQGEQVIIDITLSPLDANVGETARHCVQLLGDDLDDFLKVCYSLPEVRKQPSLASGVSTSASAQISAHESLLVMTILSDAGGAPQGGQSGATLVIRNDGRASATDAYLRVTFDDGWRLSDILTSLGLVSAVDHEAIIRLGRLEPESLVAVSLRGWASTEAKLGLCTSLYAEDQLKQGDCGAFQTIAEVR